MVADLPVLLTIRDPALAAEFAELFAPMADHAGPFVAEIRVEPEPPARPTRAPDEVYEAISLWRDGDELVVDSGGPLLAHVTATRAIVGGALGHAPSDNAMLRRIVHHVISHILSLNGRLVAHGAAVGRSGGAVLLLGGSGAGKSTSAYLASLAGWSLLGDDLIVVRLVDGGVEAIGIHRAVAVPPEVSEADAAGIELDPRHRRRPNVELDRRPHRVAAVALVAHGTGAGSVELARPLDVAGAIVGSTPAGGNTDVAAAALRVAGALAAGPCARLCLAEAPADRLAGTGRLFDEIARLAGLA